MHVLTLFFELNFQKKGIRARIFNFGSRRHKKLLFNLSKVLTKNQVYVTKFSEYQGTKYYQPTVLFLSIVY